MLQKIFFLGILQLLLPTESEKCTASCIGFHIHTECFGYIMYIKMADWKLPVTSQRSTQSLRAFPIQCVEISGDHWCRGVRDSLKICDGYVRPHWPPFSNRLSLNDPFYFFIFCSHLMIPIFKMLSHLMSWPPFLEIFIGENGCHALMLSLKLNDALHFHQ